MRWWNVVFFCDPISEFKNVELFIWYVMNFGFQECQIGANRVWSSFIWTHYKIFSLSKYYIPIDPCSHDWTTPVFLPLYLPPPLDIAVVLRPWSLLSQSTSQGGTVKSTFSRLMSLYSCWPSSLYGLGRLNPAITLCLTSEAKASVIRFWKPFDSTRLIPQRTTAYQVICGSKFDWA